MRNLSGKKFNSWTVISFHSVGRGKHYYWLCKCECGKKSSVSYSHLIYGKSKSCGCKIPRGYRHKMWKGYEEITANLWHSLTRSQRDSKYRRKIKFNITKKYIWNLFLKQNRKCALSELPIYISQKHKGKSTASLDRIDSSKGYVYNNVQWVHKDINLMKNKLDQNYFINLCKKVSKNRKIKYV